MDSISGCFGALQIGNASTRNPTLRRLWVCVLVKSSCEILRYRYANEEPVAFPYRTTATIWVYSSSPMPESGSEGSRLAQVGDAGGKGQSNVDTGLFYSLVARPENCQVSRNRATTIVGFPGS